MAITTSGSLRYSATTQLARALGALAKVPARVVGESPSFETVGVGDGTNTIFYLDQENILKGTLVLAYGATVASTTNLTETTHYTIDLTTGKITLTASGLTAVSTNNIYAKEYSYCNNGMDDDWLEQILTIAEKQVDDICNTVFVDGTATNPSYSSVVKEKHSSQGLFNKTYFTKNRPVKDVESTLASGINSSDTSLSVASGHGTNFPSSGYILIGSEVIQYTGVSTDSLTGLTRGALGSTAAAHSASDEIHTTIVQISETTEGTTPTFTTLTWGDEFEISDLGKIYIYEDTQVDNLPQDIQDRLRVTYLYGYDTVPVDITRLVIIIAKRMLASDNITKAIVAGRNEFRPEMFNTDDPQIQAIVGSYRQNPMGNT